MKKNLIIAAAILATSTVHAMDFDNEMDIPPSTQTHDMDVIPAQQTLSQMIEQAIGMLNESDRWKTDLLQKLPAYYPPEKDSKALLHADELLNQLKSLDPINNQLLLEQLMKIKKAATHSNSLASTTKLDIEDWVND